MPVCIQDCLTTEKLIDLYFVTVTVIAPKVSAVVKRTMFTVLFIVDVGTSDKILMHCRGLVLRVIYGNGSRKESQVV